MKYLILLLISFSVNADNLDTVINQTNRFMNPIKSPKAIGYDIEYREEMGSGWININKAQYLCDKTTRSVVFHGVIETKTSNYCRLM